MALLPLVYEEIKQQLLDRLGKQWPAGARLPGLEKLASELGAGQRNTLRAVQELAREGFVLSRPGRGTYVADPLPNRPQGHSTKRKRVGILVSPVPADGFLQAMINALAQGLTEAGYDAQMCIQPYEIDLRAAPWPEWDALAVINPGHPVMLDAMQKVVILSTTQHARVHASAGYDLVCADEAQGGFLAGEALRAAGCRSVCFLGKRSAGIGSALDAISMSRLRGFEAGWGRAVPRNQQLHVKRYGEGSGSRVMQDFLQMQPRPEGVFAVSDEVAIGFAMGGLAAGLEPGRDYQLVGFDGQRRGRTIIECPVLTSVEVPSAAMGARAAQLLLQRFANPAKPVERVQLGCTLFVGATVAGLATALKSVRAGVGAEASRKS